MLALLASGTAVLSGPMPRFGALSAWYSRDIDIRYGVESHFEREYRFKARFSEFPLANKSCGEQEIRRVSKASYKLAGPGS